MNRLVSILLAFCLAAAGGFALAEDAMPMNKDAMSKDAMSKGSMAKKKAMHKKKSMHKDAMKDGMNKDKGM
jgi:pentapeptide MXKDX repeat protein